MRRPSRLLAGMTTLVIQMSSPSRSRKHTVKARVREFGMPPIHDALVLGKQSPIGCVAMRKALDLLVTTPFEHIEFEDDVISDILVRSSILRRVPREQLIGFVIEHIKPMMGPEEVLHLDLDTETLLEG